MKIAIIGSGIAGNTLAWHLHRQHEITVFEAGSHIGGHTHTHQIEFFAQSYAVDTGFIVFNHQTYPNFIHLLKQLNVAEQASAMSFSVSDAKTGLEYNGTSLNSLFAQRKNLLNWKFIRMIREILRFNRESPLLLEQQDDDPSLGEYLNLHGYHQEFIEQYIVPMGAAIWSAVPATLLAFPARFFIRFFKNHGMLNVNDRPQWYVIKGGSARYVEALTKNFSDNIRLNTKVEKVERKKDHVLIHTQAMGAEKFDWVFFACHSDQALAMLDQPSALEAEVLSAIPYQENEIALHYDRQLMPKKKLAWAAWNYHIPKQAMDKVAVTYNMNILQSLQSQEPLLVTLNYLQDIDPNKIIKRLVYHHPVYTSKSIWAQQQHSVINGQQRSCFAGAYWGNGFHEDGVVSALQALKDFSQHHAK